MREIWMASVEEVECARAWPDSVPVVGEGVVIAVLSSTEAISLLSAS